MAWQTLPRRYPRRFPIASPLPFSAAPLDSSVHADPSAADKSNANTLAYWGSGKKSDDIKKVPHGVFIVMPGGAGVLVSGRW